MAESSPKQSITRRSRVKTGCVTCRTRKVKCDEGKPFCAKCVNTGRTCDGYDSRFRFLSYQPASGPSYPMDAVTQPIRPLLTRSASDDIHLLNRYFTTKTMFDVSIDCVQEAKQILLASLSNPALRYATFALQTLREDREIHENCLISATQQNPGYNRGLGQYTTALGELSSSLSSSDSHSSRSALLCCQIFISIEQVREDYVAMVQHIIQGLQIMRESRARAGLVNKCRLVPPSRDQLPLLDVFLIKLFATPCGFADIPLASGVKATPSSGCSALSRQRALHLPAIAPDMRSKLTKIAASTLEFLGKVARVETIRDALLLQDEKAALLNNLESWLTELNVVYDTGTEPLSMSFTRLFYLVLRIILLGTLDPSLSMQSETAQMQDLGSILSRRVRSYHAHRRGKKTLTER